METQNRLEHLADFKKVLKNYRPSASNLKVLDEIPLLLLVGPTAAGRNTLINLLLETGRYHYVVSDTTRKPRTNNGRKEKNGREYWFRTEEDFLQGLRDGTYLEAAIIHEQQVSGISMAELTAAASIDKIPVDEVEVVGATNINKYKPDVLTVFLLPPDFETWMKRLRDRGKMPEVEVRRRLQSAATEIAMALTGNFYQFVINHEIHEAAVKVDELARGARLDEVEQEQGRNHAEQLAVDVQIYLKNSLSA